MTPVMPAPRAAVFSVSEITGEVKRLLRASFDDVWVRGEISNFKRHGPSGHLYFRLKDDAAVLSCAMFKMVASSLRFEPADGMEVEARGAIDVYPARGEYQLVVRELLPGGRGALLLALEELRRRLGAEGLFDPARKRPLPRFPMRIGVVTSESGAAVRDILHVLERRWPIAEVVFAPVAVQGEGAAVQIALAVRRLGEWGGVDVIIVGRGGGSLEDLWAFNEEPVVRAVAACPVPIVSGVGHETDHTLCDDAADVRAPTPSAAAELVAPDRVELARRVQGWCLRLGATALRGVRERRDLFERLRSRYGFRRPQELFGRWGQDLDALHARLVLAAGGGLQRVRERARTVSARLQALSPRGVLARGYALVRLADGRLARSGGELVLGEQVEIELLRGGARATIADAWDLREEGADVRR
jgi:exodeoxyribonuclease VII large subunit